MIPDRGRSGAMSIGTADRPAPFLDVADPAFSVSSAEVRRAREAGWYARTSYGLAVLRYDQVSRLIRHPALRQGSRLWPAHHGITAGPFADWWSSWVLNMEGEAHRRMRRLLSPAFSRRIVEALRPRFRDLAGQLAGSFAGAGERDFMADFAEPYAARVIAITLGIAEDEWRTIAAESATLGLAMGVRIREHLPRIEAALAALYDYADALIAARRRELFSPRDDVVTGLVQAGEGGLTTAELRDSLVLLIFGGFDTTRNQLGLAMQVFMDHPDQWRLLGERPELGAAAVEEVMRVRPTTTWVTPGSPGRLHLRRARHRGRDHHPPVLRIGGDRRDPGRCRGVRHHRDREAGPLRLRRGNSLLPGPLRSPGRHQHGPGRAGRATG